MLCYSSMRRVRGPLCPRRDVSVGKRFTMIQTTSRQNGWAPEGRGLFAAVAGLCVLGGWLLSAALENPEFSLVGWCSLLPLFLAIRMLRPARASASAAVWGISVALFSPAAPEMGWAAGAVLFATVPALYALLGGLLTRRIGFHPLFLGLGWVGVEFALAPLSMHNGLLAGSQSSGPLLQFVGSALGYVFVAFLIALVNAVLLFVLGEIPAADGRKPVPKLSRGPISWPLPEPALAGALHLAGSFRPRAPPFRR